MNRRNFLKQASVGIAASMTIGSYSCKSSSRRRPNILFAISDDQSWPHTSIYGAKFINTPAFDRVANEGVLFNNVFCAAPQCSPDRASILTGRHIWQNEEAGTHASNFPRKLEVFTDELEKVGYELGYTGKPWGPGNWQITGWPRNPVGPEFNNIKYDTPPQPGIANNNYAENFSTFLSQKEDNRPFFFWFGAKEPHRSYLKGCGLKNGKKITDVDVPAFLPDDPEIRSDLLDYAVEIEWFDNHLQQMIALLEKQGELENTLIVVTSDNGMPFPRAKANLYEYGIHMPFAVRWGDQISGGRTVDDLISFIDIAPTFLSAANATIPDAMRGQSFLDVLLSKKSGQVNEARTQAFSGRERHTHARPNNFAYPARSIRTAQYLYIWNVKPDRWPTGNPTGSGQPEGYHDIDACPSKTFIINNREKYPVLAAASLDKRPEEEMYDIQRDPYCLTNLAEKQEFQQIKSELSESLRKELQETGDPRVSGYGDVWESYPRYSSMRKFSGFKTRGVYNSKFQLPQD
jgi:N-sulfoglucosamine sulfohydrolase